MVTIGVDIGTTTIGVVAADDGGVLCASAVKNDAALPSAYSWQHMQDPERIWQLAHEQIRCMLEQYPRTECIGVTGQQHGILYVNAEGMAVSPLYTWQDGRGEQPCEQEKSACVCLREKTGRTVAAGYGMATHYYNARQGLVPKEAAGMCTIGDYIAMRLTKSATARMDASNAASLGLFCLEDNQFDRKAVRDAGMAEELLPQLSAGPALMPKRAGQIPVAVAIGDNQASYIGATKGLPGPVLLNVGTGSQFSAYSPQLRYAQTLETRPFPLGGYLLVGASLCGGRAYAMLERFFAAVVKMATGQEMDCYDAMKRLLASQAEPENCPTVSTAFEGTRQDPDRKGAFLGVDGSNLSPLHWTWGVLHGIADELYGMYEEYVQTVGSRAETLLGSGNGLRWNEFLCRHIEQKFCCPLCLSENREEAAFGAAIFAAEALRRSNREMQKPG